MKVHNYGHDLWLYFIIRYWSMSPVSPRSYYPFSLQFVRVYILFVKFDMWYFSPKYLDNLRYSLLTRRTSPLRWRFHPYSQQILSPPSRGSCSPSYTFQGYRVSLLFRGSSGFTHTTPLICHEVLFGTPFKTEGEYFLPFRKYLKYPHSQLHPHHYCPILNIKTTSYRTSFTNFPYVHSDNEIHSFLLQNIVRPRWPMDYHGKGLYLLSSLW